MKKLDEDKINNFLTKHPSKAYLKDKYIIRLGPTDSDDEETKGKELQEVIHTMDDGVKIVLYCYE